MYFAIEGSETYYKKNLCTYESNKLIKFSDNNKITIHNCYCVNVFFHEKVQKEKKKSIFQDLILFRIGGKLKMCAVIFHQTKMNILYTYTYTQVKGCHLFGLTRLPVVYVLAPKYVCVKMR